MSFSLQPELLIPFPLSFKFNTFMYSRYPGAGNNDESKPAGGKGSYEVSS